MKNQPNQIKVETLAQNGNALGIFSTNYVRQLVNCPSAQNRNLQIWDRDSIAWMPVEIPVEQDKSASVSEASFSDDDIPMFTILSVLTLGCYPYYWYIQQGNAIRKISPNSHQNSFYWGAMFGWIAFLGIQYLSKGQFLSPEISKFLLVISSGAVAYFSLSLMLTCIGLSKDIENHIAKYRTRKIRLSKFAAALFGPFYLQYKFNRIIESNPPQILRGPPTL